ncbi:Kynurenine--oxoglutarate transaminase 1-like protein [Drosera capensis]
MEEKLSRFAKASKPSPIQQLSHLAQSSNAINLAEGFPDFPAPTHLKQAAISAINSDFNQYRHVQGICEYVAKNARDMQGLEVNPLTEVAVCCGQTEAFADVMFALIDPGDEVILFDPTYETYEGCILMAGGTPVFVPLDPPCWTLDRDKLIKACTAKTKVIVLNSPHNPTGKVFSRDELEVIAEVCNDHDYLAVTDEVYEHITFDNVKHISLASLPRMQDRIIITSSLSKTYSVTGWRIGWAIAPACIASAIKNIHVKLTDSAPAPFQEAALTALTSAPKFYASLRADYNSRRDFMVELLSGIGFQIPHKPQGSFFVFAELPKEYACSDIYFVEQLIKQAGVVAVPGCGFFHTELRSEGRPELGPEYHRRYIRFAFCKSDATLTAASQRVKALVDSAGYLKLFSTNEI